MFWYFKLFNQDYLKKYPNIKNKISKIDINKLKNSVESKIPLNILKSYGNSKYNDNYYNNILKMFHKIFNDNYTYSIIRFFSNNITQNHVYIIKINTKIMVVQSGNNDEIISTLNNYVVIDYY